ncbi:MAG: hypothetical protein ABJN65_08135 [Parasphingorhabdus sp.]
MEDAKTKQIVRYSPISPSVLFHRLRSGMTGKWDQNKMIRSVRQWLRPPRKKASVKDVDSQPSARAPNLIIPDANDPFMLMAKSDPMSSLLAENQRLRNLINDLVREDRRSNTFQVP